MMRYFTFKRAALREKRPWQKLRFTRGKGYWLFGKPPKRVDPILMYDSIDVTQIPRSAEAVAGYVNGKWKTFPELVAQWPDQTHKLSIAVASWADADCLDVERGDATNDVAPAWVKRQIARGVKRPALYSSVSNWPALEATLNRAGIRTRRTIFGKPQVRRFTAHYGAGPHLCTSKCWRGFVGTADATQFDDKAFGRNLDASVCSPSFFS